MIFEEKNVTNKKIKNKKNKKFFYLFFLFGSHFEILAAILKHRI